MIKYDFGPNAYFSREILILRSYGDLQVSFLHRKSCGRTADRVHEGSSSTPPIGRAFKHTCTHQGGWGTWVLRKPLRAHSSSGARVGLGGRGIEFNSTLGGRGMESNKGMESNMGCPKMG